MIDLHVAEAAPDDAAAMTGVIHAAFRARPALDRPGTALEETEASIRTALVDHGGLFARVDGEPAGSVLCTEVTSDDARWLGLRRVCVDPRFQRRGVATAMVGCAEEVARERGLAGVRLHARSELPETVQFWQRRGYVVVEYRGTDLFLAKALPVEVDVATAADMYALGERLATLVRAGDLLVLTGELGAGKTTLTQGLGAGLGVGGAVTSPTFVLAHVHSSLVGGPALLHVDAYRLGSALELDDLDLETATDGAATDDAVTIVEWGHGLAEGLAEDRLEIVLRHRGDQPGSAGFVNGDGNVAAAAADVVPRRVRITPVGRRWTDGRLHRMLK